MQITNYLHQLRIDFNILLAPDKVIPRFVNVFLVLGEKITLIDTGVKGSEEKIFSYIAENGRSFKEIETIILSHSHPDHIGSAARIKELTGCKVLAHHAEQAWIENIDLQEKERPVPGFKNIVDRSVGVNEFLEDGQILPLDHHLSVGVIHTPGHSVGLISLFFREDKILFSGDAIPLKNDIPNYNNFRALQESLKLIKHGITYKTLLTSWTSAIYNLDEMNRLIAEGEDYLNQIDKVVKAIYFSQENRSLELCKKAVLELGLPPFLASPIVNKAFRSHLNR